MKLFDYFKSNKGSWVLTGLLIILLMAIAAYPDFWQTEDSDSTGENIAVSNEENAQTTERAAETNGSSDLSTPVMMSDNEPAYVEDGEALPDDQDTTIAENPGIEANAESLIWIFPLSGEVGRNYGFSYDPTYNDYRFHHGIDIMAEPGTPVYAAANGTVIISREDSYWGGIVTIEHANGWQSIYRCLEPIVAYGDEPAAGEIIGYIIEEAPNESAQESHLHFELYLNGEEVDPEKWL
jgi:murein DD-endopeptidase MepM/ murein hydrolase activator NlpD